MDMRICLVSHFIDNPDEGVRNVAKTISNLFDRFEVEHKCVNISNINAIKDIYMYDPDIVHYILSPSVPGYLMTYLISCLLPKSKTVISAIHSNIPKLRILSIFNPDIVYVQSHASEDVFSYLGVNTFFLPNGVDTDKFHPCEVPDRIRLRKKYGVPIDKFVILHLASMKAGRNLDVFKELQKQDQYQVLIIGRESEDTDYDLYGDLTDCGCMVLLKYYPDIQELYNLSDCYVFPTLDPKYCIETPLSVLEAMACNLPVISTRFGSLSRLFMDGGNGLIFADSESNILSSVALVKKGSISVSTRNLVMPYSWNNIGKKLLKSYSSLNTV